MTNFYPLDKVEYQIAILNVFITLIVSINAYSILLGFWYFRKYFQKPRSTDTDKDLEMQLWNIKMR